MKKYIVSDSNYSIAMGIDFSHMGDTIKFVDNENTIETSDTRELLLTINDEIVEKGLTEDQEFANEYGRQLYSLYDEIYYQKIL